MAEYDDCSALCRAMFEKLARPVSVRSGTSCELKWMPGQRLLLRAGWADAFAEHAPRKCLVSLGSPLPEAQRDNLDILGWYSKRGSLGYDQSVGQVIVNLQVTISHNLNALGARYSELDLHRDLMGFVSTKFDVSAEAADNTLPPPALRGHCCCAHFRGRSSTSRSC